MIYLDHAAATPLDDEVLKAMQSFLTDQYQNPSAMSLAARSIRQDIEAARSTVAKVLGARSSEITFTAGGTEANNLAIQGVMNSFPKAHMVVSAIEHDSVLEPARLYDHTEVPVTATGHVTPESLATVVKDNTVLISIMYANNEIGTIQPLHKIAQVIEDIKADRKKRGVDTPLYFHSDACQAGNYLSLNVARIGVDLLTLNAGKVYGPKQVGALFIRTGVSLQPLILGGGQEHGMRSGTENVANIVGFSNALKKAQDMHKSENERLKKLRKNCIEQLQASASVELTTNSKNVLPNMIHIHLPGHDNERLMMALDEVGIQVAVGSACSASNDEPSHVLEAIGLSNQQARSSLRISMGRSTSEKDLKILVKELTKHIA